MKNCRYVGVIAVFCLTAGSIARADDSHLDEIIVTAQKRQESAQNVPIAITTIDAASMEKFGLTDTNNIQFATPGLEVTSLVGYSEAYIRGVGSDLTQGIDNSVAMNIDGVYIPTVTVQLQDLVGLDRIEVLKGPQGTLYGRNATGGAINIVTKNPELDSSSGTVTIGYGNYADRKVTGYASTPFTSTLAGNLAFSYNQHSPFDRNLLAGGASLRDFEDGVARAKLLFKPLDSLEFLLAYMHTTKIDDASEFGQQISPHSVGGALGGLTTSAPYEAYFDGEPRFDAKFDLYSLRAKAEFAALDVVSISAYQSTNAHEDLDYDGTNLPIFYFKVHNYSDVFTQELQFLSKQDSAVNWITGLYFLNSEFSFAPVTLVAPPAPTFIYSKDRTRSYSGFGQATIHLIDKLDVTAGVRYTHDLKTLPLDDLVVAGVGTLPFGGLSRSWSKTTPKVTVDYHLTPAVMLWTSAGIGFKSGGYADSSPTMVGPVNPETLDAVEAGVKSQLDDNRVRVNLSLYKYHISNQQVQSSTGVGTAFLQNAGKATIQGGELEASAKLTQNLQIDAGMAVIDGKYTQFTDFAGFAVSPGGVGYMNVPTDVTGFGTPRSPKHTYNVGAEYTQPLPSGQLFANGLLSYSDTYAFDPAHQTNQPSIAMLNGSLGYLTENGRLRFTVWGQNLTQRVYYETQNINALGIFNTFAAPRTYGGTITYNFL